MNLMSIRSICKFEFESTDEFLISSYLFIDILNANQKLCNLVSHCEAPQNTQQIYEIFPVIQDRQTHLDDVRLIISWKAKRAFDKLGHNVSHNGCSDNDYDDIFLGESRQVSIPIDRENCEAE